ncbi:MAG: regulatory protein RecX [Nitrospirae bacterium]|nr:regulatory protein RecX [Nitrospirota bacterium]
MTDSAGDAKKYAFRLLAYRDRSRAELRERLEKKGFPGDVISVAMAELQKSGYLDDRALAKNLRRQATDNRLLGFQGIKRFMGKRGLSPEVIDEALDYDEDAEISNARRLLEKKLRSMGDHLTIRHRRRLWNFLTRRGYSFGVIRKVLEGIEFHEETEE